MPLLAKSELLSFVGKPAVQAYTSVVLSHPVNKASLFSYKSPPKLQQRVELTEEENRLIDAALKLRSMSCIPFWEALMSVCLAGGHCTDSILTAAFFHNGQGDETEVSRADIECGKLESATNSGQANVALGSKVILDNDEERHLGLLDFHCDISDNNTDIVNRVCRVLMPAGFVVVDSGDSYHACSIALQTLGERTRMLGKALLVSPIVDAQYIAHQLQQSSSSIRISRGGKAKSLPKVVDAWVP